MGGDNSKAKPVVEARPRENRPVRIDPKAIGALLAKLPDDVFATILSNFSLQEKLLCACLVNRDWNRVACQSSWRVLDFGSCAGRVNDRVLAHFVQVHNMGDLHTILLRCCSITDGGLDLLLSRCPMLQKLELDFTIISNTGLQSVARRCPNLVELKLQNSRRSGVEGLCAIAAHGKLRRLHIANFEAFSNGSEGLERIAQLSPQLEYLDISLCRTVTDENILRVFELCPRLSTLRARSCSFSTAIQSLCLRATSLTDIDVSHLNVSSNFTTPDSPFCSLEKLRRLEVDSSGPGPLYVPVRASWASTLCELRFVVQAQIDPGSVTMLLRVCTQLHTLQLGCINMPELLPVLSRPFLVEELTLSSFSECSPKKLFSALSEPAAHPNLRKLILTNQLSNVDLADSDWFLSLHPRVSLML
eukprot:gnl/Spiro4/24661_TR12234_c0_g1_i1.p1 gnl/Spiro4/24661_TR12234_c0_g1~~gnl/Spiro4/24661_TR12234_c0_g1_i1.p1  ORF type:complete len:426 (+),score=115.10 gnl/Spiro4/24661_TR12234_c0_g1_i1:30-1280(+)